MATFGQIARGLNDVKIAVLDGSEAPSSTLVDGPGARTFTPSIDQNTEDYEGDDKVIATAADAKKGSFTLAMGSHSLAFLAAALGGTVTATGTAPNITQNSYSEQAEGDAPYVQLSAQSRARDLAGSAYRITLPKASFRSPSESLAINAYNEVSYQGSFLAKESDGILIKRDQYKVLTAIA